MVRVLRNILLGLVGLVTGGWSAEPSEVADLAALIDRIESHLPALREVCAQQLDDGVPRGFWTSEEKLYAEDTLRSIFESQILSAGGHAEGRQRLMPSRVISDDIAWLQLFSRGSQDPSRSTTVLFDWLGARVRSLSELREAARRALVSLAIEQVEQGWLSARSAEDLAPTLATLRHAQLVSRTLHDRQWRAAATAPSHPAFPSSRLHLSSGPKDAETALLIDYWSLLSPEQPLLLPAEDADFADFARFRIIAVLLERKGMVVFARPGVAARIAALRSRFRDRLAAIQQTLDEAIVRDLPPEDFARELRPLAALSELEPPTVEDRKRRYNGPPSSPPPFPPDSIDYRDVAAPETAALFELHHESGRTQVVWQPGKLLRMIGLPEARDGYAAWLAFRTAESSGTAEEVAVAVGRLRRARLTFQAPVIAHLERRLQAFGHDGAPVRGAAPGEGVTGTDPVESLIAVLESLARSESRPDVGQLAASWRALRQPEAANLSQRREDASLIWASLLSTPGWLPLAELRDRAVRALLGPGDGVPGPGPDLLRQLLSAALKRDSFAEAARLLAIAEAAAMLSSAEVSAYRAEIETLQSIPTGDASRDRSALRSLILRAGERVTGEIAARRWKAMR